MFANLTAPNIIAEATAFVGLIDGVVLLVIGLGLVFTVAGWVTYKLARR